MIYERDGKWYFSDEAEQEHGPYNSKLEATIALDRYTNIELNCVCSCTDCSLLSPMQPCEACPNRIER
jgi:hypothetical protein